MKLNKKQLEEIIRYEYRRLAEQGPAIDPAQLPPEGEGPESSYAGIQRQYDRKTVDDAIGTVAEQLSKIGSAEALAQELALILHKLGVDENVFENVRYYIPKKLQTMSPKREEG